MKHLGSGNTAKGLTKEEQEENMTVISVMIWSPDGAQDFSVVEFCEK